MRCLPSLFCFLFVLNLSSQEAQIDFKKQFRYNISKTSEQIKIDGQLTEATWQSCERGTDFWQKVPFYAEHAEPKTEIMLSYDENFLYVSAICHQTDPIFLTSLKRDEYWDNDGIAIILDPLNTKSNSVLFGTSAVGVQWDAERSQTSGINPDWSNKWYVETEITDTYWSAEFAIPLKILRYDPALEEWGMNFVRNIQHRNEFHNWTAVPEGFWPPDPTFAGALVWDTPPSRKKGNFNIIPYGLSSVSKVAGSDAEVDFQAGIDAKVSLSSSLNLDLTINPDFSQADADELVTNLTRFDIFLPERRNFFLENADLFGGFGNGNTRPLFTRTIGLDKNRQAVPILYGARLTGNATPTTRIGLLNIQSRTTDESLGQNQSALVINKRFGRSFIQGMFLNRQAYDKAEIQKGDYGRNFCLESFYGSPNGRFNAWAGGHLSFKPEIKENTTFMSFGLNYTDNSWEITSDLNMIEENYYTDMGYVIRVENYDAVNDTFIRLGYNSTYTSIDYRIRPKDGNIANHRFGLENLMVFNTDWSFNERYNRIRYFLSLRNTSEFKIRLNYRDLDLLYPFSFTNKEPLPVGRYHATDVNLEYESDERKLLSFELSAQTGGFYNGRLTKFEGEANIRIQPWGNFGIGYQWNDLEFPEPYGSLRITALISKIEIGFNKNLLWTTILQYVEQSDFLGINSRLQWRFSPMSDLFIVYVDNYDVLENMSSNPLNSKNRALILKANYWY